MASKNPLQTMKCMKKRAYESEVVANNVIQGMESAHGRKQKAYKCGHCNAWHTCTVGASKTKDLKPKPLKTRGFH